MFPLFVLVDIKHRVASLFHFSFWLKRPNSVMRMIEINKVILNYSQLFLIIPEISFHSLNRIQNRRRGFKHADNLYKEEFSKL